MKRFLLRRSQWLLLAAVLLGAGALVLWDVGTQRDHIEAQELARLSNQSKVIETIFSRQFNAVDHSLKLIANEVPGWTGRNDRRQTALETLKNAADAVTTVRSFIVTDASGKAVLSSNDSLIGRDYSGRDFFQMPKQTVNPELVYLSAPFKAASGVMLMGLSRLLLDNQGRFAGVVAATLDAEDLGPLLESTRYAEDMKVSLAFENGEVFVQRPVDAAMTLVNLAAPGSDFVAHLRSGRMLDLFNGRLRNPAGPNLSVLHTFEISGIRLDSHFVLVTSRSLNGVLEAWRRDNINKLIVYFLLVTFSVTGLRVHRVRRREKLVAAKRIKLATEASGVGIWEFDLWTKRYYWDAAMFQLFEQDENKVSLRNDEWRSLLSAEDLKRMREATRATIHGNQPFDLSFAIRLKDGTLRYMRNRAALYSDENGSPRRLIGASEDITERREHEVELRIAAAAFESHESTMVTDATSTILRVNQAFCKLFGYASADVIGRNPRLLQSGRHDAEFYAVLWAELVSLQHWSGEIWNVRSNGEEIPCWMSITAVRDQTGVVTHYVATHTDITKRKALEDEVRHLAFYDPLTNLPNRRVLSDRLRQAIAQAKRSHGHLALMFVDLDKFKPVNDVHGHSAGDLLLQEVALRLRACVRETDTVARVGGDEFVVLLPVVARTQDVVLVAEKIQSAMRRAFDLPGDVTVHISASTGIALYPEHGDNSAELSQNADVAMYAAKAAGRDQFMLLEPVQAPSAPTH